MPALDIATCMQHMSTAAQQRWFQKADHVRDDLHVQLMMTSSSTPSSSSRSLTGPFWKA